MMWYDGGKLPPEELFQGEKLIGRDGGSLVIGSKGTLFTRTWHGGENEADMFLLLPRKQFEGVQMPTPSLPRPQSHHFEWVDACRGRGKTLSDFGYASRLSESLLLGNVALAHRKVDSMGFIGHARDERAGSGPVHQADVPPGVVAVAERSGPLGNRCKSVEPLLSESCLD